MRQTNRKLNLNRETLQSLSKETLENVAGGEGLTDYTKYASQVINGVRKVTQYVPTLRGCSIGQACAH
jgi:hypothetical protein